MIDNIKNTKYLNKLLESRTYTDVLEVKYHYDIASRFYHTWDHIIEMIDRVERIPDITTELKDDIFLAILFHDIIYIPGSKRNERISADFFTACIKNAEEPAMIERNSAIHNAIIRTDYSVFRYSDTYPKLDKILQKVDLWGIFHGDTSRIMKDTYNVYKEFRHLEPSLKRFKKANLEFMEKFIFEGRTDWGVPDITFARHAKIVNSITEW